MSDRAPVGELDGIVVLELSLDVNHEISNLLACIRAGAAAWAQTPFSGMVDVALRPKNVEQVLALADELEAEAARVRAAREAAYARRAKEERKRGR